MWGGRTNAQPSSEWDADPSDADSRVSKERVKVALACEECGARNYRTTKAKKMGQQKRLALKKFCPTCNRHTVHKESK